jgi:hypothetical protein
MPEADDVPRTLTRVATDLPFSGDPGIAVNHDHEASLTEPAELRDPDLQHEIELVTELVLAASASAAPLTDTEIDRVLGLA